MLQLILRAAAFALMSVPLILGAWREFHPAGHRRLILAAGLLCSVVLSVMYSFPVSEIRHGTAAERLPTVLFGIVLFGIFNFVLFLFGRGCGAVARRILK